MKLLREPLVHFLAIGGLLFAIFAFVDYRKEHRSAQRIYVTAQTEQKRATEFQMRHGRPPDAAEQQKLMEDVVREEVLVREAKARGLEADDPVIRAQLQRRMEDLTIDPANQVQPTDQELVEFLRQRVSDFKAADGHVPALPEIREAVVRAWLREKNRASLDAAYQAFRSRYEIVVEPGAKGP
jgi:hypothetical protein